MSDYLWATPVWMMLMPEIPLPTFHWIPCTPYPDKLPRWVQDHDPGDEHETRPITITHLSYDITVTKEQIMEAKRLITDTLDARLRNGLGKMFEVNVCGTWRSFCLRSTKYNDGWAGQTAFACELIRVPDKLDSDQGHVPLRIELQLHDLRAGRLRVIEPTLEEQIVDLTDQLANAKRRDQEARTDNEKMGARIMRHDEENEKLRAQVRQREDQLSAVTSERNLLGVELNNIQRQLSKLREVLK